MFFNDETKSSKKAVRVFGGPCELEMRVYTEEKGRFQRQICLADISVGFPIGYGEDELAALREWLQNAKKLQAKQAARIAEIEKLLAPGAGPGQK